MPLKFSYTVKVKRYNVNLMNKNKSEPIYLWIEHDEEVTLTYLVLLCITLCPLLFCNHLWCKCLYMCMLIIDASMLIVMCIHAYCYVWTQGCSCVVCFDNVCTLLDYILHWLWIYEGSGPLCVYFMSNTKHRIVRPRSSGNVNINL